MVFDCIFLILLWVYFFPFCCQVSTLIIFADCNPDSDFNFYYILGTASVLSALCIELPKVVAFCVRERVASLVSCKSLNIFWHACFIHFCCQVTVLGTLMIFFKLLL